MILRAARLFDRVVVAVLENDSKAPAFTAAEREELLRACAADPRIEVVRGGGLTAELARRVGASAIVRGARDTQDFAAEARMAELNRRLCGIDTILLPARPEFVCVSSTAIREIASRGGDITGMVPEIIRTAIERRFAPK